MTLWITDPGAPPVRATNDVDVVVEVPAILGFANRWQGAGIPHAITWSLPSAATIRAVSPPYLLATKLEAFKSRGNRDFLGSRDFGDIIALVDGREELVNEVAQAPAGVRGYIASEIGDLLEDPRFVGGLFGALPPDNASQARADAVVAPRLRTLVS
ncbi:MAG: hypothetical protein ACR2NA_04085 [Solirubrobacterales bacterium]